MRKRKGLYLFFFYWIFFLFCFLFRCVSVIGLLWNKFIFPYKNRIREIKNALRFLIIFYLLFNFHQFFSNRIKNQQQQQQPKQTSMANFSSTQISNLIFKLIFLLRSKQVCLLCILCSALFLNSSSRFYFASLTFAFFQLIQWNR